MFGEGFGEAIKVGESVDIQGVGWPLMVVYPYDFSVLRSNKNKNTMIFKDYSIHRWVFTCVFK